MANQIAVPMPSRFVYPSAGRTVLYVLLFWFVLNSLGGAGISVEEFLEGLPNMRRLVAEMFPPSLARMDAVGAALLQTFQMAVAGTLLGVFFSLPLGVLASRTQTPNRILYSCSRLLISFFRTVPDLIWALFFVATVGLGPFAGALALMVDTIGFCGRFFAEAFEEVHPGPQEALTAIGAGKASVFACSVLPAALPSLTNTALFSLEKATRSSVVLGLVGAGGIGIELKVSMDMFRYAEASTIILSIFALVVLVETISSKIRQRII